MCEEGATSMFRRENKTDSFDRQMDALRDQLGDGASFDDEPASQPAQQPPAQQPPAPQFAAPEVYAAPTQPARDYGFGQASTPSRPALQMSEPEAPATPTIPDVDARTTVIAHDTQWKGDITSDGSVHIHGRFDGSVRAKVAIFVAEGAEVDAALAADSIVVAGSSKGSIRAQSRFEALPSGRVAGDIVSPTLVVHEGATISGQLRMAAGEAAPETAQAPTPVVQRRAARGTA